MKIVIAVNAFKGSISSVDAGKAIARGIRKAIPDAETIICPVADGGDGLLEVAESLPGARIISCNVIGPRMKKLKSKFCWLPSERTAIIEMALASGLALLNEKMRNPMETTTYGTGQLIARALKLKPRKIILGIGGSATCDGGTGAAAALGIAFKNRSGRIIPMPAGKDLRKIHSIDMSSAKEMSGVEFEIICDVENPLLGPRGSAAVYAPQKGATPSQVKQLESGLANFAKIVFRHTGKDIRKLRGGGAAGGISAGFTGLLEASLKKGIDVVLELVGLEEKLRGADLAVTGEGMMDSQTAYGKAPAGVAKLARRENIPCIAICGCNGKGVGSLGRTGISSVWPICREAKSADDSMRNAAKYLEITAEKAIRKGRLT